MNGCQVDGPNGNAIFLPAAGYCDASGLRREGDVGDYWSGSLHTAYSDSALYLNFESYGVLYSSWTDRRYGFPVRPVRP